MKTGIPVATAICDFILSVLLLVVTVYSIIITAIYSLTFFAVGLFFPILLPFTFIISIIPFILAGLCCCVAIYGIAAGVMKIIGATCAKPNHTLNFSAVSLAVDIILLFVSITLIYFNVSHSETIDQLYLIYKTPLYLSIIISAAAVLGIIFNSVCIGTLQPRKPEIISTYKN